MKHVEDNLRRLRTWEEQPLDHRSFKTWVNTAPAERWGKKAACRVYQVAQTGHDVEFDDPFSRACRLRKMYGRRDKCLRSPELPPLFMTSAKQCPGSRLHEITSKRGWTGNRTSQTLWMTSLTCRNPSLMVDPITGHCTVRASADDLP